jgi:hypothetical protein
MNGSERRRAAASGVARAGIGDSGGRSDLQQPHDARYERKPPFGAKSGVLHRPAFAQPGKHGQTGDNPALRRLPPSCQRSQSGRRDSDADSKNAGILPFQDTIYMSAACTVFEREANPRPRPPRLVAAVEKIILVERGQ